MGAGAGFGTSGAGLETSGSGSGSVTDTCGIIVDCCFSAPKFAQSSVCLSFLSSTGCSVAALAGVAPKLAQSDAGSDCFDSGTFEKNRKLEPNFLVQFARTFTN